MTRFAALILPLLFCACSSKPDVKRDAIARVGESYLFREDIKDIVPPGTQNEDSTVIVRNFINRWASQKLLFNAAELNLTDEKKASFDNLLRQYKADLYTKAYVEEIVKRAVDTVVTDSELKQYYSANKQNFKTNGALVRLRYINLKKDNPQLAVIKSRFFNYNKSDRKFWDTHALQFNSFAFNDSVWVAMGQVYSRLPFITPDNRERYIVPGKSIEYPDSLDVYLVKITNVIEKNQISPYEYVKPTLKEVLLNQRKLELIKKFEKEITDDAIKNKEYEIYK